MTDRQLLDSFTYQRSKGACLTYVVKIFADEYEIWLDEGRLARARPLVVGNVSHLEAMGALAVSAIEDLV